MLSLIFTTDGHRKYLTTEERGAILDRASRRDVRVYTFCLVLASTGCRISEALTLSLAHIDRGSQSVVVECLKKRRRGVYRSIPIPAALVDLLYAVHGGEGNAPGAPLWSWSRMTAWRKVHEMMSLAGVRGHQACPKGFRHGFGVAAVQSGVPLNMVQKWLGHADMRTTAIYTCAIGPEELAIAARMWRGHADLMPSQRNIKV